MSWSGPCSERYDAHPAESPGCNTNNARKCGHAFCKECLRKSQKKPRPCLSCGTVPTPYAKAGGDECYNHDMNQFQQLLRKYCKGPSLTAKGNKRVRKPGDDEFGLQPRLARPRATKKPAGGRGEGQEEEPRITAGGEEEWHNQTNPNQRQQLSPRVRQEALEPDSSQRKDGGGAGPGEKVVSTRVWFADKCLLPLSASPCCEHRSEYQLPRRRAVPASQLWLKHQTPTALLRADKDG